MWNGSEEVADGLFSGTNETWEGSEAGGVNVEVCIPVPLLMLFFALLGWRDRAWRGREI